MSRCSYSHLRLLPKRPLVQRAASSQPPLRHVSVNHHAKRKTPFLEPTPSQLLRFALTGTTQPAQNGTRNPELDQQLQDLFLEEWPFNSAPPPSWGSFLQKGTGLNPKVLLKGLRHDVRSLRHLQTFLERNVNVAGSGALLQTESCKPLAQTLERCERFDSYRDILTAINGIIARIKRLRDPVNSELYVLGMRYACSCLSVPALKYHLEGYHKAGFRKLDTETSVVLIKSLLSSLHSMQSEDPGFNTSPILDLVIGGGSEQASQYNLHDILCWAGPEGSIESIDEYVPLLMMQRSDASLHSVWNRLLLAISPASSSRTFQSAYACMMAMIDTAKPETAVKYLRQISKRAGNTLPGISQFEKLGVLLSDTKICEVLPDLAGEKEYLNVLDNQLGYLEKRLGINWQPEKSLHASVSDPDCIATGQSLITIDGDSAGFDSSSRLVSEIQALGCSRSSMDLGRIAYLLDEHEGSEIPVSLPTSGHTSYEFVWLPQRSPIEFSNCLLPGKTDMSAPWSNATLGLIQAKLVRDGVVASDRSLHLMQLGYLVMRTAPQDKAVSEKQGAWQESGHIVAWDRTGGQFLAVFIGQGYGVVDPGLRSQSRQIPSGLGAIARITLSGDIDTPSPANSAPSLGANSAGYRFDVDPSPDLVF